MVDEQPTSQVKDAKDEADAEKRREVRRGHKAIETLREIFAALEVKEIEAVNGLLAAVGVQLDALRPPDKRRCKEYLRAVGRSKKGLLGISPEDVVLYCRCEECSVLRLKLNVTQPSGILEIEVPELEVPEMAEEDGADAAAEEELTSAVEAETSGSA